ncbi:hypothetical protein [Nocardia amamiensis]|uniref:hypothetical protein n=1 Tax=Nocardia amamiensis TaxID=404578 RepID=UPI00082F3B22|nr:hypothetical protein [Nocardia amamiensis]
MPPITLLHRRLIALAVEDYAPGYAAPLHCPCAAHDAARYVAAYDLPPLVPLYGLKALEHAAHLHIQHHPDLLARTPAECAARHAAREREGQRLAAAAIAAHRAGHTQRAALLIDDAELINPRFDWSGYRALLPAAPILAAAG